MPPTPCIWLEEIPKHPNNPTMTTPKPCIWLEEVPKNPIVGKVLWLFLQTCDGSCVVVGCDPQHNLNGECVCVCVCVCLLTDKTTLRVIRRLGGGEGGVSVCGGGTSHCNTKQHKATQSSNTQQQHKATQSNTKQQHKATTQSNANISSPELQAYHSLGSAQKVNLDI